MAPLAREVKIHKHFLELFDSEFLSNDVAITVNIYRSEISDAICLKILPHISSICISRHYVRSKSVVMV